MPLEYFYKSRILTITHNAYYNLGLREINYLVTKNSNSHNLRKSLNVVLTRPETELGRRSFVHRSAIAWNALPDNLKDSTNPSIFKHNVKRSKQTILNINFGKGGNVIYNMKPCRFLLLLKFLLVYLIYLIYVLYSTCISYDY